MLLEADTTFLDRIDILQSNLVVSCSYKIINRLIYTQVVRNCIDCLVLNCTYILAFALRK